MSSEEFNNWAEIADTFGKATSQIIRKTAFAIQAGYQERVPHDTGFAANSAYVLTSRDNTYGQAKPSKPDAYLLPSVDAPDDDQTAYIGVGANYALFLELGTVHMPAQPAFIPAVDAARPGFEDALSAIEKKLQGVRN
ncbi:MAG: hypothetical protein ACRDHZ_02425 [Ktedonobacteraceae bacterium]